MTICQCQFGRVKKYLTDNTMNLWNASLPSDTLRGFTRSRTSTSTSTLTDAELDASLNTYMDIFTIDILESMDEWDFQAEIATTDLVAGQQEYVFPTDILKIKRVEVTFDGTTWQLANPMDINEVGKPTDTTSIAQNFSITNPFYDLMDDSVMMYPIPSVAVTGGIKIWYEKLQTYLTADTDTPNFARPFHKGLCYGAAKDYFEKYLEVKGNDTKMVNAKNNMDEIIAKMKAYYRRKNQDRAYIVMAGETDYDYGNY